MESILPCAQGLITDFLALQMLENLVIAVESESQVMDIGRVSGFMQKVSYVALVVAHELMSRNSLQVRDGII